MCSSSSCQCPGLRPCLSRYEGGAEAFTTPHSTLSPAQSTQGFVNPPQSTQGYEWIHEASTSPSTNSQNADSDAIPHRPRANRPREERCSTHNEDRILDKLPPKICKKESAERPFLMSQTLIAVNERTLRGWEAFKVFPPHATLNLKEYPHTQGQALPGITELIVLAIWQSPEKRLSIQEIYEAIELRFPPVSLKKRNAVRESIRHNLSLKQCFVKMKRPSYDFVRRGMLWTVDPSKLKLNCSHRCLSRRSSVGKARRATCIQDEPTIYRHHPSTTPPAQAYEIPDSSAYHVVDSVSPGYPDTFPPHKPLSYLTPDPFCYSTQPESAGFTMTPDYSWMGSELEFDHHRFNDCEAQQAYSKHQPQNFYLSHDAFEEVMSPWAHGHDEPRYDIHDLQ